MTIFSRNILLTLFWLVVLIKVAILFVVFHTGNDFFGGGNDSEYYHAYAVGDDDYAVNLWPIILRGMNDFGLYSRESTSLILKVLGLLVIPFFVAKLCRLKDTPENKKIFWIVMIIIGLYPTMFYYTTDIYRDVFMVFMWLISLFILRAQSQTTNKLNSFWLFIISLGFGYLLYELRPYLGLGFYAAVFFSAFYSFRRYPLFLSFVAIILVIHILFIFGFLNPILTYRAMFQNELTGGSNLSITFASNSMFIVDLFKTISFQLFGLFFVNVPSILVFLIESVPFIIFLIYVIKNRKYSTKFVDYLIVFFVSYSVVWLLGNDNLGTAVRLRMFNYIAILIAFFIIYQRKKIHMLVNVSTRSKVIE